MDKIVDHIPVLLEEIVDNLKNLKIKNGIIIDATFGLGSYSNAILENTNCKVYGFDRDPEVMKYASKLKEKYKNRFKFFQKKFSEIEHTIFTEIECKNNIKGIIFDLGVSNLQLKKNKRGFSFKHDGPLDMRMSKEGLKAFDVINNFSEENLSNIFYTLGDEVYSRKIAKNIVKFRQNRSINTTIELADIIRKTVPGRPKKIDKATKTFQAIRMLVNDELNELKKGLVTSENILARGGTLCVVSFHSKEDKLVKNFLNICQGKTKTFISKFLPPEPNIKNSFEIITKKPITPSIREIKINPKSRSAKLRIAKRTKFCPIYNREIAA
ncbi:MAG: hypothetical protein CMN44_03060 [SAR116 cluster bacterium]|nr:hypothetical protein [SAR116 cluster bacterium]RPH11107.1 MAG: 16S rRNA (cytosine(1402)-N(4))-methyltransferase RsmH [Alphaproteobacteria bacterium TMED54]